MPWLIGGIIALVGLVWYERRKFSQTLQQEGWVPTGPVAPPSSAASGFTAQPNAMAGYNLAPGSLGTWTSKGSSAGPSGLWTPGATLNINSGPLPSSITSVTSDNQNVYMNNTFSGAQSVAISPMMQGTAHLTVTWTDSKGTPQTSTFTLVAQ
jgi:hypothetical protein